MPCQSASSSEPAKTGPETRFLQVMGLVWAANLALVFHRRMSDSEIGDYTLRGRKFFDSHPYIHLGLWLTSDKRQVVRISLG
jgi:hypothetical protein